jgi:TonB family protein
MIKLFIAILALSVAVVESSAQGATSVQTQENVVLSELFKPVYPPLARQARITGDVELVLQIKKDGSVQSVDVVKGHPLLKQAALDSAQQSRFECRTCGETVSYRMVFTFQLLGSESCCKAEADSNAKENGPIPRVLQSGKHVTVIDQPTCICDPAAYVRVRSVKCLYLWKCGVA